VSASPVPRPDLVRALSAPDAWPGAPATVERIETHVSDLFLTPDRVLKVKKPVELGFLDFSTLELRRAACEDEVRLNTRISPDLYLGVVPITRDAAGAPRIDGDGEVVEWGVLMRRLPSGRMLSALLDRGEVDNALLGGLAAYLVRFHAACDTGEGVDENGSLGVLMRNAEENFEQLEPFVGDAERPAPSGLAALSPELHAFLRAWTERAHGLLADRFAERVRAGRIREGHGDLHAGNVCFPEGEPVLYDCIEFNRRFRCGDVARELAFLAMDFDRRGFGGFGAWLVRRYAELAGDPELVELVPYYKTYLAVVRGKVACFAASAEGASPERRAEQLAEARSALALAAAYALPPAVVLTCGLPATGKTTVARAVALTLHGALLRSDVRRKLLAGVPLTEHGAHDFGEGLYAPGMGERTYRSLLEMASAAAAHERTAVVDATFAQAVWRRAFRDAASRLGRPFYLLEVIAPEELVRARMERRANDPGEVSDADWAVYARARDAFEEPDELPSELVVRFESSEGGALEAAVELVERRVLLEGPGLLAD
jgi:aminoglycoside phosphotransferase family enzyme